MKKLLICLVLLSGFCASAQSNAPETAPDPKNEFRLGLVKLLLVPSAEVSYERIVTDIFSFGASGQVNFAKPSELSNEKFSLTPYARLYYSDYRDYGGEGYFLEGFFKYQSAEDEVYYYEQDTYANKDYNAGFAGLSIGSKYIIDPGIVIEFLFGGGRRVFGGTDDTPEFILRADIFVGYRF